METMSAGPSLSMSVSYTVDRTLSILINIVDLLLASHLTVNYCDSKSGERIFLQMTVKDNTFIFETNIYDLKLTTT